MTTVVQTKNLTKTYAMGEMQVQALDGVDFSVSAANLSLLSVNQAAANRRSCICLAVWMSLQAAA